MYKNANAADLCTSQILHLTSKQACLLSAVLIQNVMKPVNKTTQTSDDHIIPHSSLPSVLKYTYSLLFAILTYPMACEPESLNCALKTAIE